MKITNMLRKNVMNFPLYKASPTLEQVSDELGILPSNIIKLDSGENGYMEKYQNRKVLQKTPLFTYPDPLCTTLRGKLADYVGVEKTCIICGNGSDELIDLIIRAFVGVRDEIIINPPTFPMYEFYGKLSNAKVISILRKKDFSLDVESIKKSISRKTKIIFIDSPGNPTSIVTPNSALEKILKSNVIVVVDEAYFEYYGKSASSLLRKYPNLVILRTFSKWAGLAGLRIGYAIADADIINILTSIKAPYNVNSMAQDVACEVLDNKEIFLKGIKKLINCRDDTIKQLTQFPKIKVYSSQGAYILFKPEKDAQDLQLFLKNNGFLVKLVNQPLLKDCIRMNIAKDRDIKIFIKFLRGYYKKISY